MQQEYLLQDAVEGYTERLDIFSKPRMDAGILYSDYVQIHPTSTLSNEGAILFKVDGTNGGYLNTRNLQMTVAMKIVKSDNSPVTISDDVSLTNQPLYSVFRQVNATINNSYINSDVGGLYAHKNYYKALFGNTKGKNSSYDRMRGYFPDDEDNLAVVRAIPSTEQSTFNDGVLSRHKLTHKGQVAEFKGPLGLDFIDDLDKILVNGCEIVFEFQQQSDAFRLLSPTEGANYKLLITKMYLTVNYIRIRPEILLSHSEKFAQNSGLNAAQFTYPRTMMRLFTIPAGVKSWEASGVLGDKIPYQLALTLVNDVAYSGSYSKNPFNLENCKVEYASFEIDGRSVPDKPLTPNFATGEVIEAFHAMVKAHRHPELCTLTPVEFQKGRSVFCFNVEESTYGTDMEGVYPILKRGSTRLNISFKEALITSMVVIISAQVIGDFTISKSRLVTVNQ